MELIFRRQHGGEMERPPTQRDQFNNDDVELVCVFHAIAGTVPR